MKNQQTKHNHVKMISIIHINNIENNPEIKKYSNDKRNTLTKTIDNNRNNNNNTLKQYNTINDVNRISKKIYRPKIKSNIDLNNNINKREINLNKNNRDKIHLIRNSEGQLLSYNNFSTNNINNNFKKIINFHRKNNSNFHIINQTKNTNRTQRNSKDKSPIYENHSTIFISGSTRHSKEKNKNINKNVNITKIVKNMPKLNFAKLKEISDYRKKAQTSRQIITNNKLEEIKDTKNQNQIQNLEKEGNKVKFSRRLEITEKTAVLLPNQTFKPFEQFEKKEKPIIEIKKNLDGTNVKVIKEILIKTSIENTLIDVPKIPIVKNAPQVNLIKQKITKEYITTIKFYSNIIDLNENSNVNNNNNSYNNNNVNNKSESQKKKSNSNHDLIEIKPEKQLNNKNGQNIINHEKETKINYEPLTDRGTNGFEKNSIYKSILNEKNKRNIKNTVYSNVINNNINKPHRRNSNSKKNAKIDNMFRKNIQNKNFHTINSIHRKNKYNGNIGLNTNLNINKNNDINLMDNNNINEISSIKKEFNYLQGLSNESQLLSNIMNVNGSVNSFSISDSKYSSKVLFDFPFNLDLEKNDSEKLEDKEKIIYNEKDKKEEIEKVEKIEEKKVVNNSENKYEKLNEFIMEFNDEKEKPDLNNNNQNEEKNNLKKGKSPDIENQNEEKILNQMQLSNINLTFKEFEENENDDNNAYYGENTNNCDKKDLTGSIMFINSNIDKNIHIQNGLENYSINMDGNSITDNFNIIEGENLSTKNDKEFIDKMENIKNKINNENKNEDNIEDNNLDEKVELIENEIEDENKFYSPLNKYENKFNLDQINPF